MDIKLGWLLSRYGSEAGMTVRIGSNLTSFILA